MYQVVERTMAILAVGAGLLAVSAYAAVNKGIVIDSGVPAMGQSTVNGSIVVGSGATVEGALETVNGAIRIDDDVQLEDASTVNGSIEIGDRVTAEDVESVNGSIELGENARVAGEVSTVNGRISLAGGSSVGGDVANVNGELRIEDTDIGGNLSTVSGEVWLMQNSVLSGDLVVERAGGSRRERRKPKIVIGPGSSVVGAIVAHREIDLYISETANVREVTGEVSFADAQRFAGERP